MNQRNRSKKFSPGQERGKLSRTHFSFHAILWYGSLIILDIQIISDINICISIRFELLWFAVLTPF